MLVIRISVSICFERMGVNYCNPIYNMAVSKESDAAKISYKDYRESNLQSLFYVFITHHNSIATASLNRKDRFHNTLQLSLLVGI